MFARPCNNGKNVKVAGREPACCRDESSAPRRWRQPVRGPESRTRGAMWAAYPLAGGMSA
jgi:hypothetical protein